METRPQKEVTQSKIAIRLLKELKLLKVFKKYLNAEGHAFKKYDIDYKITNLTEYCRIIDEDESFANEFFMAAFDWDETNIDLMVWAVVHNHWTDSLNDEYYGRFGYDFENLSKNLERLVDKIKKELLEEHNIDLDELEIKDCLY